MEALMGFVIVYCGKFKRLPAKKVNENWKFQYSYRLHHKKKIKILWMPKHFFMMWFITNLKFFQFQFNISLKFYFNNFISINICHILTFVSQYCFCEIISRPFKNLDIKILVWASALQKHCRNSLITDILE